MLIKYYGHACFAVTSENYTVVIDPYAHNSVPGLPALRIDAQKVLCTHTHDDHNNKSAVRILASGSSPFTYKTVKSFHDDDGGAKRGKNSIFVLCAEGLRVAHFGDLGCRLTPEQISELGALDAVMIPVGGYYTIDAAIAAETVRALGVKVVIPMHYRTEKSGYGVLATVDDFLSLMTEFEVYDYGDTLELTPDTEKQVAVLSFG